MDHRAHYSRSMSPLTRVPITDKNGKQTTVLKNLQPAPTATATSIPAPAPVKDKTSKVQQEIIEKQHLRDAIYEMAVNPDHGNGVNSPDEMRRALEAIKDLGKLQRTLEVAKAVRDNNIPDGDMGHDWWIFARALNSRSMEIGYRNLDVIRKSDEQHNGFNAVTKLHRNLETRMNKGGDKDFFIDRMDNHLYAYETLRRSDTYESSSGDWSNYADRYAPLVARYPDHCEQLCAYLIERGGYKAFDVQGFTNYLNAAPALAEGTL